MGCACIAKMDEQLGIHGVRVDQASIRTWTEEDPRGSLTQRVRLHTVWAGGKGRQKIGAIATFCPFCGERYLTEAPSQPAVGGSSPKAPDAGQAMSTPKNPSGFNPL